MNIKTNLSKCPSNEQSFVEASKRSPKGDLSPNASIPAINKEFELISGWDSVNDNNDLLKQFQIKLQQDGVSPKIKGSFKKC
jgi:hypothetical protein